MGVPHEPFFYKDDDSVYVNVPYAEAYIPEDLFTVEAETKTSVAVEYGDGFKVVGMVNMRFFEDESDPREESPLRTINYPNMITTYPSAAIIATLQLSPILPPEKYRVLKYQFGDVFMEANSVESVNNCTKFMNMITKGKIPNSVGYDEFILMWANNFKINNFNPGVPSVLLQMVWAHMCRCADDPSKPFRMEYASGKADPHNYISSNMNNVAAASSVFSGMSFERIAEKTAAAVNMSRAGTPQMRSPVEEVLTM